jgi:hypothetical protein
MARLSLHVKEKQKQGKPCYPNPTQCIEFVRQGEISFPYFLQEKSCLF